MTSNRLKHKLTEIASCYQVSVEFDADPPGKNDATFAVGEIMLGEFDDEDEMVAAFFHELGHCITKSNCNLRIETEIFCWRVGFDVMIANGFCIKDVHIRMCLDCIESYADHEFREYTEDALLKLRTQIRGGR